MRQVLLNLAVGFAGLVFAVVAVEIAFRLFLGGANNVQQWYDRPPFYYYPASATNHTGQSHLPQKTASTFRIAVVGDSFSFGPFLNYDDTFSARLERMLNQNGEDLRAEVVNYGIPGYATSHQVDLVKRAIAEEADLVILQVTLNDTEIKAFAPNGALVTTNRYGASVIRQKRDNLDFSKVLKFLAVKYDTYKSQQTYKGYFNSLFTNPHGVRNFERSVDAIKKLCVDHDVPLVTVTFPLFGNRIDSHYPFENLHAFFAEKFGEREILNLDLLDLYREIPPERLQVMPGDDFHPNEIAHRMAAETIYTYLAQQGQIPQPLLIRNLYRYRRHVRPTRADHQHRQELLEQFGVAGRAK